MLSHAAQHVQFFARLAVMPQGVCFVALNIELDGDGLSPAFATNNLREKTTTSASSLQEHDQ